LSFSAYEEFGDHQRDAHGKDATDIKKNKRGAAILPRDIGIAPYVAQANGGSHRRQNEACGA